MKTMLRALAALLALAPAGALALDIRAGNTAIAVPFLVTDSAGVGLTGLAPTVTISRNGGSFATPGGTVSEVGAGWYKLAPSAGDTGTVGPLVLHATAPGAAATDVTATIVAVDPADPAGFGLARLDAAVSSRSTFAGGAVSGITGVAFPANFAILAIDGGGSVTAAGIVKTCLVVSGSTASVVTVSGLPAGGVYVGQHIYHKPSGQGRAIASQSYSGGNYTFTLGAGAGTGGPFPSAPLAGEVMAIGL